MGIIYRLANRFDGTYTARIATNFLQLLWDLIPELVFSIILGATLNYWFKRAHPAYKPVHNTCFIILAAIAGIISPLPSYLALPTGLALTASGVPYGAVIAFAVASPLINPSIFYLTWTQLGLRMALARTGSAFILAILAGFTFPLISRKPAPIPIEDNPSSVSLSKRPYWMELYRYTRYTIKYFSLAILISAAIRALIPATVISRFMGETPQWSILTAMALGIPLYQCGGAAIPLIQTLQDLGMNQGAALAFFIAGPATKVETLTVYGNLLGWKTALYYLIFTLAGAFLSGAVYWRLLG